MKNELGLRIVKMFALDKRLLRFSKEQKVLEELHILHGGIDNGRQLYRGYLAKKVKYLFIGIFSVGILALFVFLMPQEIGELSENTILRNGYDEAEKSIILVAKSEGMEEEIEIQLEPMHYSKEQLDSMADEVFLLLSTEVFLKSGTYESADYENNDYESNKNKSNEYSSKLYVVCEHMEFPTALEGYPFSIGWESSNYNVLDNDGSIMENISEEGEIICVTAKLSCYEYVWEKEYALQVFPVAKVWEECFLEEIEKSIEELDNKTSEEEVFLLPQTVNGHTVVYEEKTENSYGKIIIIGVILLICIWFSMDSNLSKQMENRDRQLLIDYAKLVSKLSLYLGAGLSFRTAIRRIVESLDKNRFVTKELEIAVRELENGIAESKVIDSFANRCRLPCYIKLSVLINQNIRKGNNNLQKQLKEEADKAFEERKNLARKYGEEAGTKLLFPMLLMLVVVMVMIIYPAFVSFTV